MDDKEWALLKRLDENLREKRDENERLAKIDWDKVRVDAAIAAMQGLCNSCHESVIRDIQESSDKERSNVISFLAVRMADSLVRELRKEEMR
jgi:hypothetical protein